jgi:hypothetical protein
VSFVAGDSVLVAVELRRVPGLTPVDRCRTGGSHLVARSVADRRFRRRRDSRGRGRRNHNRAGGGATATGVVGTTGATGCTATSKVVTGAATMIVVGAVVVGFALDASTTRATVLSWSVYERAT